MKITEKKKNKDKLSIAIEGNLTIYSVKELKDKFSGYLEENKNFEVDLSAVDAVDTAGFQLIALLRKEVSDRNKNFKVINPSNEVIRIFDLYGEVL